MWATGEQPLNRPEFRESGSDQQQVVPQGETHLRMTTSLAPSTSRWGFAVRELFSHPRLQGINSVIP